MYIDFREEQNIHSLDKESTDMNAVKAIYHDGMIEMLEKPVFRQPVEVLVIFPKPEKSVMKLRGLCKEDEVDYAQIEQDLKVLRHQSEEHLLSEWSAKT